MSNDLAATRRLEPVVLPLLTAGVLLVLWNYAVKWSHTNVFPSPLAVEHGTAELIAERRVVALHRRLAASGRARLSQRDHRRHPVRVAARLVPGCRAPS